MKLLSLHGCWSAGFTDNSSVNTLPLLERGEVLAMTETVKGTYRVAIPDLQTISRADLGSSVPGDLTTAHPAVYPDGSVYNLAIDVSVCSHAGLRSSFSITNQLM